jgi:hypothetical protein
MARPTIRADAILQHVASWGDRFPHTHRIRSQCRFVKRSTSQASRLGAPCSQQVRCLFGRPRERTERMNLDWGD